VRKVVVGKAGAIGGENLIATGLKDREDLAWRKSTKRATPTKQGTLLGTAQEGAERKARTTPETRVLGQFGGELKARERSKLEGALGDYESGRTSGVHKEKK